MQVVDKLASGAKAPIRLGLSAGGIGLSAMRSVVEEARRRLGSDSSRSDGWTRPSPEPVSSPAPDIRRRGRSAVDGADAPSGSPAQAPEAVDPPPPVAPAAAAGPAIPIIPAPGAKRIDDEPVPVAEVAEPGAEDGAGAEVRVDPPWDGYDSMTAADVRDRLVAADAEIAAAVTLYESAGKGRVSVIRAAERRLSSAARLQD
jgi:hypothetical protein